LSDRRGRPDGRRSREGGDGMMLGLAPVQDDDLWAALEAVILPQLTELLHSRGAGHCARVTDLDAGLMARLCGRLRAELPDCEVVMLGGDPAQGPPGMYVTATKLVELRNPMPDGRQRPPLLVFIPSDVRAAAEDS